MSDPFDPVMPAGRGAQRPQPARRWWQDDDAPARLTALIDLALATGSTHLVIRPDRPNFVEASWTASFDGGSAPDIALRDEEHIWFITWAPLDSQDMDFSGGYRWSL
jgi:hypothetical protein